MFMMYFLKRKSLLYPYTFSKQNITVSVLPIMSCDIMICFECDDTYSTSPVYSVLPMVSCHIMICVKLSVMTRIVHHLCTAHITLPMVSSWSWHIMICVMCYDTYRTSPVYSAHHTPHGVMSYHDLCYVL